MRTDFAAPPLKHFGNLVMMGVAFVGVGVAMAMPGTSYEKEAAYLWVFMAFLLYGIVKFLRMPYRIRVGEDGITLKAVAREATVRPDEVSGIVTESFGYYVHFNTGQGTFVVLKSMDGLRELVAWVRERNPSVTVRGL